MKFFLLVSTIALSSLLPAIAAPGDATTTSIGVSFCFGDGTSGACPCGNPGVPGAGCDNSSNTGGAALVARGTADLCNSMDSLTLTATGERPTALSIFIQGDTAIMPVTYGQGLRCIADTSQLIRFGTQVAVAGTVTYPKIGDCAVHLAVQPNNAGGCHGLTGDTSIACGKTRYYQVFYRDPVVLGGCPVTSTYNISNAVSVTW
jgi:hypothetical protein